MIPTYCAANAPLFALVNQSMNMAKSCGKAAIMTIETANIV